MGKVAKKSSKNDWCLVGLLLLGMTMVGVAVEPLIRSVWQGFWTQQRELAVLPVDVAILWAKMEEHPKILGDFTQVTAQEPLIVDELDYGNIENWFVKKVLPESQQTASSYTLEIEKLKIFNALVKVGGTNINHNLVQFNTEPQIGGYGAPVIFGHSTLRQFYNPKETNKDRYKSIFSTIMTLDIGDTIKITTGELTYTYTVVEKKEVPPDDDYILAQDPTRKQIKLVTCVPEGTRLRRGVITAELK